MAVSITFPPTVQEGSLFSTPSPAFVVCRFSDDAHSKWCEVIPQKYGTLHEFVCHPCAGAMLIFSVLFQFQYMCCRSEHCLSSSLLSSCFLFKNAPYVKDQHLSGYLVGVTSCPYSHLGNHLWPRYLGCLMPFKLPQDTQALGKLRILPVLQEKHPGFYTLYFQ